MNPKKLIIVTFLTAFLVIGIVLIFGWLVSNNQLKHECKANSDCELAYTGSNICPPCDTSVEEYECLPLEEAVKIKEERRKKEKDVYCLECLEEPQHNCVCEECDGCHGKECLKMKKQSAQQVTITIDKTEYERGEMVKIMVENNLDENIKYIKNCFTEPYKIFRFINNNEWFNLVIESYENCPYVIEESHELYYEKIDASQSIDFNWNQGMILPDLGQAGAGIYKVSFSFKESEVLEEKTIYSNEFMIKEKSALDPRCSEKVRGIVPCRGSTAGYEFDLIAKKCVRKAIAEYCSVETPFNSLEECQEVCEKKDMSCKQGVDCIEKCPKCIDNPPLSTGCASQPRCVNEICKCICNCLPSKLLPH